MEEAENAGTWQTVFRILYVYLPPGSGFVIICTDPDPDPIPDPSIKKSKNKEIVDFHSCVTSL